MKIQKKYKDQRIMSKILKMDEKNQYGNAMTKQKTKNLPRIEKI